MPGGLWFDADISGAGALVNIAATGTAGSRGANGSALSPVGASYR